MMDRSVTADQPGRLRVALPLRRVRALAVALAATVFATAAVPAIGAAQAQLAPHCGPGQAPAFERGIAALKQRVGDPMGQPIECEHVNPENGDVLQRTTTGLAYYRTGLNMPAFTTGVETWALSPNGRGLILWTGGSIDPPVPTAEEDRFFRQWLPILDREIAASNRVGPLDTALAAGRLDTVDLADVRAALTEMRAVQADFAALRPPPRLVRGHALWLNRVDAFGDYVELTLRALESSDPDARTSLLQQAEGALDRSVQAGRDANTALEAVLPREIDQLHQAGFPGFPPR